MIGRAARAAAYRTSGRYRPRVGSTSWTPYIVCTSSGQNAPNVARKISLFRFVPSVRKSSGNQGGRRDRAQELDRHAERARGELARAEDDSQRHREQRRERQADRPTAHGLSRTRPRSRGLHHRPELAEGRRSSTGGLALRSRRRARSAPRRRGRRGSTAPGREAPGPRRSRACRRSSWGCDRIRGCRDVPGSRHDRCISHGTRGSRAPCLTPPESA